MVFYHINRDVTKTQNDLLNRCVKMPVTNLQLKGKMILLLAESQKA